MVVCNSLSVVLRLFCEFAYTKTIAPKAKNNIAATVAIFKVFLMYSYHHIFRKRSFAVIKLFFRIDPHSIPNLNLVSNANWDAAGVLNV